MKNLYCETKNPLYDLSVYLGRDLSDLEWSLDDDNDERETDPAIIDDTLKQIRGILDWQEQFAIANRELNRLYNETHKLGLL